MKPLISIILPFYNAQQYLAEAVESVLANTFTEFELLCIDDGSTDNGVATVKQFADRDPRIQLLQTQHEGIVMKTNQSYILFLIFMVILFSITNALSQAVILDNFQNDFKDAPSQNRLSAAHGYVKFGPENSKKSGGKWSMYFDNKGSKVTSYNDTEITVSNPDDMIYNNTLHVNLLTSTSRQDYPFAGIRTYLLGGKNDYHDLSKVKAISIRCKGEGYVRLALETEDILTADSGGFYGANFTLDPEWKTFTITADMLKPEPYYHAYFEKWAWDHGKSKVHCLKIFAGFYSDAEIFIDEIIFHGISYADFGFKYDETPYETSALTVTSNIQSPIITTTGSGTYINSDRVLLGAFSSEPFYTFKHWSIIKGIIAISAPDKQESYITVSQDAEMQAVFEYTGPEKGPYYITVSNNSVTEETPGAIIGTVTVYNRDKKQKHKLTVNDNRFAIKKDKLQLKKGISLNYITSPSIQVEFTANDREKLSYKRAFPIHVINKGPLENIKYGGFRSSYFGVKPFPGEKKWGNAIKTISSQFPGSTPTGVWILGRLDSNNCKLEFPSNGKTYDHIRFHTPEQGDKHEPYLTHFDSTGITVYLQIEPAFASVDTLIDLVLRKYSNHTCVVGFGIDVEWLQTAWGKTNDTIAPTDKQAQTWEKKVKSYNPNYKLFLKHWLVSCMPPTYRGDIVFIDDSQGFIEMEHMAVEFLGWANHFPDNIVMYQLGYPIDYHWWKQSKSPPKTLGEAIAEKIIYANPKQEVGIIWVDYTYENPEIEGLMR